MLVRLQPGARRRAEGQDWRGQQYRRFAFSAPARSAGAWSSAGSSAGTSAVDRVRSKERLVPHHAEPPEAEEVPVAVEHRKACEFDRLAQVAAERPVDRDPAPGVAPGREPPQAVPSGSRSYSTHRSSQLRPVISASAPSEATSSDSRTMHPLSSDCQTNRAGRHGGTLPLSTGGAMLASSSETQAPPVQRRPP